MKPKSNLFKSSIALVLMVLLVGLVVGTILYAKGHFNHDTIITVSLQEPDVTRELSVGTLVTLGGAPIGEVRALSPFPDGKKVVATIALTGEPSLIQAICRSDTTFSVRKLEVSLSAGVKNPGTLFQGASISVHPGTSQLSRTAFEISTLSSDFVSFFVTARTVPGVRVGSPIHFSETVPIGKVLALSVDPQGWVLVECGVERRYQQLITKGSRIWNVGSAEIRGSMLDFSARISPLSAINGALAIDNQAGSHEVAPAGWGFQLLEEAPVQISPHPNSATYTVYSNDVALIDGMPVLYREEKVACIESARPNLAGGWSGKITVHPRYQRLFMSGTRLYKTPPLEASLSLTGKLQTQGSAAALLDRSVELVIVKTPSQSNTSPLPNGSSLLVASQPQKGWVIETQHAQSRNDLGEVIYSSSPHQLVVADQLRIDSKLEPSMPSPSFDVKFVVTEGTIIGIMLPSAETSQIVPEAGDFKGALGGVPVQGAITPGGGFRIALLTSHPWYSTPRVQTTVLTTLQDPLLQQLAAFVSP